VVFGYEMSHLSTFLVHKLKPFSDRSSTADVLFIAEVG
jgi:hypothetical protein